MSQLIKQIELLMLSLLYRRGITKQLTVMLDIIAQSDNYRISSIILRSHFDKNDVISIFNTYEISNNILVYCFIIYPIYCLYVLN